MTDVADHIETAEDRMRAAGAATTTPAQVDYFAFEETEQVFLPDGTSFVEIKVLTEGDRKKYQNKLNRDVKLERTTGDAIMQMATGEERHALLESAIVGWNLMKNGRPIPFQASTLKEFLNSANPRIVDIIEKAVRKSNPWLMADLSVEDIDKQIAELEEMREVKVREEEGKDTSNVA
jgi:hypothetical protein